MAKKNTIKDLQRLVAKAKKAHERMSLEVAEAQKRVIRLAAVLVKLEAQLNATAGPVRPTVARAKRAPAAKRVVGAKRAPAAKRAVGAKRTPTAKRATTARRAPAKRATTAKRAPAKRVARTPRPRVAAPPAPSGPTFV